MVLRPLPGWYLAVLLPPADREGAIELPERARDNRTDALVLAAPPSAHPWWDVAPQARVGDRIVFQAYAFRPSHEEVGFIHDRDLVAVIPGPEHTTLLPANDYAAVVCDRLEDVAERPSGILVASYALAGDRPRRLRRGRELLREARVYAFRWLCQQLDPSEKARLMRSVGLDVGVVDDRRLVMATNRLVARLDRYWRWEFRRALLQWSAALSPDDQETLREFMDRGDSDRDDTWEYYVSPSRAEPPGSGRVQAVGPGKIVQHGPSAGQRRLPVAAPKVGQKVYWEGACLGVDLYLGEWLRLLPVESLACTLQTAPNGQLEGVVTSAAAGSTPGREEHLAWAQ